MTTSRRSGWAVLALLLGATAAFAASTEDVPLATSYPSPSGDYRDLVVAEILRGAPSGASFTGDVTVDDNGLQACQVGYQGGQLIVEGDLDVQDTTSGQSVLFADGTTGRVGMGTRTPQGLLDVRGHAMANIVAAHTQEPTNFINQPWAEIGSPGATTRVGGAVHQGDWRWISIHLDGNPLVLQSTVKQAWFGGPFVTGGLGRGRVLIKRLYPPNPDPYPNEQILLVGSPGDGSVARAAEWRVTSSRAYKTDIQALEAADHAARLSELAGTDVVRFRSKLESSAHPRRLGFIAEDVPAEMAGEGRKSLSLAETAAYLLSAAKGLQEEQQQLRRELEALQP